ncbi:MAG: hypothetical protein JWQ70_198, partial [Aeromicrobium sp.]|nr:hypothetical protein [Aeromicrobium sp.]
LINAGNTVDSRSCVLDDPAPGSYTCTFPGVTLNSDYTVEVTQNIEDSDSQTIPTGTFTVGPTSSPTPPQQSQSAQQSQARESDDRAAASVAARPDTHNNNTEPDIHTQHISDDGASGDRSGRQLTDQAQESQSLRSHEATAGDGDRRNGHLRDGPGSGSVSL